MNHFVEMCQSAFPDSNIATKLALKRTKVTCLLDNVIGNAVENKNVKILQEQCFSILLDESTDIANEKNLWILTRSLSENHSSFVTYLLDYIKIEDAGAENLFKVFQHCLSKHGLSVNNIVGYFCDNAHVMLGKHNSFMSRLLEQNRDVVVLGCICHSLHLVASNASEVLPKNLESLLHLIFSYFSRSPKRQDVLNNLQSFMKLSKQKMINPSKTRWLALGNCVPRVLSQWSVLYSLFAEANIKDKNPIVDIIFTDLNNLFTKAYLQFLNIVLALFNSFNMLFQSEKLLISSLATQCEKFVRLLGSNVLRADTLVSEKIFTCNPNHPSNLLTLNKIKIWAATEETLQEIRDSNINDMSHDIQTFRMRCLQFYQVAFDESVKRLPLQKGLIHSLIFLEPSNALGKNVSINTRLPKEVILTAFQFKSEKQLCI